MSLSKKQMEEEMQKPLLLPQKKWHNQLCESACIQKGQDTQSQPASDVQFLVRKSFLKGKSKRNPTRRHSGKSPSSWRPPPWPRRPPPSPRLSSRSPPPPAASAALLPAGASFPAPFSSAPLVFLLEFAEDVESVYKLSAQTWRKQERYSQGKKPDLPASLIFCF